MSRDRQSGRTEPDLEAMLREVARRESDRLVKHPSYEYLVLSRLGLLDREELDRLGEHLSLCVECAQTVLRFAAAISRSQEGEVGGPVAVLVPSSAARRPDVEAVTPRMRQLLSDYGIPAKDAEALLTQIFLRCRHGWEKVRDPEGWLLGILKQYCSNYWRARQRRA